MDNQATQAIHRYFPPHKQMNTIARGGEKLARMNAFVDAVIEHSRDLKRQVAEASDDQLSSIPLYTGWPEYTPLSQPDGVEEDGGNEEPVGAETVLGPLEALKAKIDRVRQTGSVDPSSVDDIEPLTTNDLINMVADDPPGSAVELEEAVRAIKGEARRRFSEQLNVELAELKNSRGMAGEDLKREQQVEYLLGLFARLGEI